MTAQLIAPPSRHTSPTRPATKVRSPLRSVAANETIPRLPAAHEERSSTQSAHRALFTSGAGINAADRHLIAAFVAGLSDPGSAAAAWHRDRTANPAVLDRLLEAAAAPGPWGTLRGAKFAAAGAPGEWWQVPTPQRVVLGPLLTAVIEHAHYLALNPGAPRGKVLATLAAAGWARAQIVVWSQLFSFIDYQLRVADAWTSAESA